jgi:nicotinamidase-related amidase
MSLEVNVKETALVLIDLQKAIVGRQLAPYSGADVVERGAKLAEAMRAAGGPVIYVHVLVAEVLRLTTDVSMPAPSEPPPADASDVVQEAGFDKEKDVLVTKRQWDAFYATGLDQQLRRRGVKTIVLAGIATNMGVESTARSAQARGYEVVFAEDAMTSMSQEMHEFATKKIFTMIGRVRSSEEIIAALGGKKAEAKDESKPADEPKEDPIAYN